MSIVSLSLQTFPTLYSDPHHLLRQKQTFFLRSQIKQKSTKKNNPHNRNQAVRMTPQTITHKNYKYTEFVNGMKAIFKPL